MDCKNCGYFMQLVSREKIQFGLVWETWICTNCNHVDHDTAINESA